LEKESPDPQSNHNRYPKDLNILCKPIWLAVMRQGFLAGISKLLRGFIHRIPVFLFDSRTEIDLARGNFTNAIFCEKISFVV